MYNIKLLWELDVWQNTNVRILENRKRNGINLNLEPHTHKEQTQYPTYRPIHVLPVAPHS